MNDISRKVHILRRLLIRIISFPVMKIKLFLFNIPNGRGCKFFGQTYFYKEKESVIILGRNLTFLSCPNSNLIGINRNCFVSTLARNAKIIIGDGCGFSGTVIGAFARIELEKNVRCGANTLITDSDWHSEDPRSRPAKPVKIGENVWLGEGVKVLKGVTIGRNSVIGAGSVVVSDIPENVVAAGNPARVIRKIDL
jgi:acetyltransferase-like isoleucine patch superfamily enzyme